MLVDPIIRLLFSQVHPLDDISHAPEETNNFVVTPTSDCIESCQRYFDEALQKLFKSNRGGSIVCVLKHCEPSIEGGNSYAEFQRIVMKHSREARSRGICVNGAVYQVSSCSVDLFQIARSTHTHTLARTHMHIIFSISFSVFPCPHNTHNRPVPLHVSVHPLFSCPPPSCSW